MSPRKGDPVSTWIIEYIVDIDNRKYGLLSHCSGESQPQSCRAGPSADLLPRAFL